MTSTQTTIPNRYLEQYQQRMQQAPADIHQFCQSDLTSERRAVLLAWLRDVDDSDSAQALQIKFAFSVPSQEALELLMRLPISAIVSMGAGTAYWEQLLAQTGLTVVPVDNQSWYPAQMLYMPVVEGSTDILSTSMAAIVAQYRSQLSTAVETYCDELHPRMSLSQLQLLSTVFSALAVPSWTETALFLAWPDDSETSRFGRECIERFQGLWVIHVGELVGSTASSNPWGQSTAQQGQEQLFLRFRKVAEVKLPTWPGHCDRLSVWRRAGPAVSCMGGDFVYVPPLP
jgi:hypothetical protein